MQGPIAAAVVAGLAPRRCMAAMVASITPATAPRQPAWAAATTPACLSANRIGAQSAVTMPSATSGRSVTMASACGPAPGGQGAATCTTSGPCTCVSPTSAGRVCTDRARARGRGSPARVTRVVTGEAAVEAGVRTRGDAATTGKETVRHSQPEGAERLGACAHGVGQTRILEGAGSQGGKPPAP